MNMESHDYAQVELNWRTMYDVKMAVAHHSGDVTEHDWSIVLKQQTLCPNRGVRCDVIVNCNRGSSCTGVYNRKRASQTRAKFRVTTLSATLQPKQVF